MLCHSQLCASDLPTPGEVQREQLGTAACYNLQAFISDAKAAAEAHMSQLGASGNSEESFVSNVNIPVELKALQVCVTGGKLGDCRLGYPAANSEADQPRCLHVQARLAALVANWDSMSNSPSLQQADPHPSQQERSSEAYCWQPFRFSLVSCKRAKPTRASSRTPVANSRLTSFNCLQYLAGSLSSRSKELVGSVSLRKLSVCHTSGR